MVSLTLLTFPRSLRGVVIVDFCGAVLAFVCCLIVVRTLVAVFVVVVVFHGVIVPSVLVAVVICFMTSVWFLAEYADVVSVVETLCWVFITVACWHGTFGAPLDLADHFFGVFVFDEDARVDESVHVIVLIHHVAVDRLEIWVYHSFGVKWF